MAPLVGKTGGDFISRDPVARQSESLGVALFGGCQVASVEAIVGGPAVVEVMEQLGFVQGQIHVIAPAEDVAVEGPASGFELLAGAEQGGVVGHMKHCWKT